MDIQGARIVVQGFGQVGSWTVRLLCEMGCKVVAVSDVEGGVYYPRGVDIGLLMQHKKDAGTVVGLPGSEPITNEELLELECEFLIPAAIDRVIDERNAPKVRAKVVVEAANHPLTPEADSILTERGITVVPDILVNAGGVIVSYFEWTQNLYQHQWEMERVNDELNKIMTRAYKSVKERSDYENITYREAAFLIGLERVARVAAMRGFI